MPTFQYEAMNAAGQEVKAEIEALTSDEAISRIRSQGYFPTKVREKSLKKGKKGAPDPSVAATGPRKKAGGCPLVLGGYHPRR